MGALLASACGDGVIGSGGPTAPGGNVSMTITLSDYPALGTVGGMARVNGVATPIVVVRTAANTYVALSLVCPHQGSTVAIVAGGFRCPNHRATFSPNGTWTGGQSTSNLKAFTTTLNVASGTLALSGTAGTGRTGHGDDDD